MALGGIALGGSFRRSGLGGLAFSAIAITVSTAISIILGKCSRGWEGIDNVRQQRSGHECKAESKCGDWTESFECHDVFLDDRRLM